MHLTPEHRRAIEAHGERGYPEEVCGFLIGKTVGGVKTVTRLVEIENTWDEAGSAEFADVAKVGAAFAGASRKRRFQIPPDEYFKAETEARAQGEGVLGFYHSHPDHPARPSAYDLALAQEIF